MRPPHPRLALASLTLFMLASTAALADIAPPPNVQPPPPPPSYVNGGLGSLSPIHWIIVAFMVIVVAMTLWSYVRLLHRTHRSGWWALLMFVPLVNVIGLWIWAFTPNGKRPTNA